MAQMATILPNPNLHAFQPNRPRLQRQKSRLNPTSRPVFSSLVQTEKNKAHLFNLEKLLHKDDATTTVTMQPKPKRKPMPIVPVPNTGQVPEDSRARGLLEMFNLARMWPEGLLGRAGELAADMSPRQLKRLQRLLSMQAEYSPRNHLGARWREYHGSKDWAGLLDPLDENLRREVVRYGEFIQAAYKAFNSNPATNPEGVESPRPVELPDGSYKVTKSLYATSSIGLPKWVDEVAPDLGWMTQRSSWIGYVAVCQDEREIARMGRRDIVLALRGTSTCLEWAENVRDLLVPMENHPDSDTAHGQAKAECGFLSLFRTPGEHMPSLAESVVQEIRRLLKMYEGETLSITITGHSLGAALSLLVADEISTCTPEVPPVAVFSFGGPRVGNRSFADQIKSKNVKVLRIVNNQDVITRVPGMFVSEELDHKLRNNPHVERLLNALDDKMPWAYAHVGTEFRVDTKMSPFLKPNADVACCHDLEAYLHLVDGFLASNCPFRSNAKRSLLKLLSEQGANVKKLYTSKSKSKSMTLKIERDGNGIVSMSNCMLSPSLQHE